MSVTTPTNEYSKQIGVNSNQGEDLADFVLRVVKEQEITYREVVRRAERKGFNITHGYISRLVSREAINPSVEKMQALAAGLGRPEEEIFRAARGGDTADKIDDPVASAMLYKYTQLTDANKKELSTLIKAVDREIEERLQKQSKK